MAEKRKRLCKFDARKKQRYLTFLAEGSTRRSSAASAGISFQTVLNHRASDSEFAAAESDAEGKMVCAVEGFLFAAAKKGNVTAQQVILYNRASDRWADRRNIQLTGAGGGPIQFQPFNLESEETSKRFHDLVRDTARPWPDSGDESGRNGNGRQ